MSTKIKHPAQFTPAVVDVMVKVLDQHDVTGLAIDPFAGPGMSLHRFANPDRKIVGIEIEPPWVTAPEVKQGDATVMKGVRRNSVSAFLSSWVYGNRFSDSHNAQERCRECKGTGKIGRKKCSKCENGRRNHTRRGYTHDIREQTGDETYALHENNAGRMHFRSEQYKDLHRKHAALALEKAKPGGIYVLNVSDFVERGQIVHAATWHLNTMQAAGWLWIDAYAIATPRMRYGANNQLRPENEWVFVFRKMEEAA